MHVCVPPSACVPVHLSACSGVRADLLCCLGLASFVPSSAATYWMSLTSEKRTIKLSRPCCVVTVAGQSHPLIGECTVCRCVEAFRECVGAGFGEGSAHFSHVFLYRLTLRERGSRVAPRSWHTRVFPSSLPLTRTHPCLSLLLLLAPYLPRLLSLSFAALLGWWWWWWWLGDCFAVVLLLTPFFFLIAASSRRCRHARIGGGPCARACARRDL